MGLLSSLKRKSSEPAARRLPPQDPAQVELLRTRARRRLIGVAVLVGLAVVALPYVFEATPRPARPELAVRMPGEPAEIVMREGTAAGLQSGADPAGATASQPAMAASAAAAAASQAPGLSATQMAMAGAGAAAVGAAAGMAVAKGPKDDIITEPRDTQAEARERERQKAAADKAAAEKAERAEKARQERLRLERAREKAEKEKAEKAERAERAEKARREREKDKARDERRYVVQVGSFSEARTVRETRQRVEGLGLKSFEQHVETSSGRRTRVRLGPFSTKEEAARAASKLKAAGVSAAVLPL